MSKRNHTHDLSHLAERPEVIKEIWTNDDRFTILRYFMQEREAIRLRRADGDSAPWTGDGILQTKFFCNTFRWFDKVTQFYLDWWRTIPNQNWDNIVFNTVMFRQINHPPAIQVIKPLNIDRYYHQKIRILRDLEVCEGGSSKVFNNARMNNFCSSLQLSCVALFEQRYLTFASSIKSVVLPTIVESKTIQETVQVLVEKLNSVSIVMAYEIAVDLTYTPVLENALDMDKWFNIQSLGVWRGYNKLKRREFNATIPSKREGTALDQCRLWLAHVKDMWPWPKTKCTLHMCEIHHCLCELDKYTRVVEGGRYLRDYNKGGMI